MEKLNTQDSLGASVVRGAKFSEAMDIHGYYQLECYDKDGNLKWSDDIHNLVVTVGKNLSLDTILGGSGYTVTGPFMGLLGGTGTIVAGDTMASHSGWTEVGGTNAPVYTGDRKTAAFSAASAGAKALSSALSFAITSAGTVKGAFVVFGSGAVATKDNTSGTLFSAGLFTGGDKVVDNGDTINVSYSVSV
jgi:hypothetical protein